MLLKLTMTALLVVGAVIAMPRGDWPPGWGDPPVAGECKNTHNIADPDWVDYGCYAGYPACKAKYSSEGKALPGAKCCQDWNWNGPCITLIACQDTNDGSGPGEDQSCNLFTYRRRCDPLFGGGRDGNYCHYCKNNLPTGQVDLGCNAVDPNCEAGDLHYGDKCFFCKNDKPVGTRDKGCPNDKLNCLAPDGEYGQACAFQCENNSKDPEVKDLGCEDDDFPNCDAPLGELGTECVKQCWNNRTLNTPNTPDAGCTEDNPVCLAELDEIGTECVVCINDVVGGRDTGCPRERRVCGCSKGHGTCNTNVQDGAGDLCFKCQHTRGPGMNDWFVDEGCSSGNKVCNAQQYLGYGNECRS